jgi:hypothetical protein
VWLLLLACAHRPAAPAPAAPGALLDIQGHKVAQVSVGEMRAGVGDTWSCAMTVAADGTLEARRAGRTPVPTPAICACGNRTRRLPEADLATPQALLSGAALSTPHDPEFGAPSRTIYASLTLVPSGTLEITDREPLIAWFSSACGRSGAGTGTP